MVEENGVTKFRQEGHEKEQRKLFDMIAAKESSNQSMLLSG